MSPSHASSVDCAVTTAFVEHSERISSFPLRGHSFLSKHLLDHGSLLNRLLLPCLLPITVCLINLQNKRPFHSKWAFPLQPHTLTTISKTYLPAEVCHTPETQTISVVRMEGVGRFGLGGGEGREKDSEWPSIAEPILHRYNRKNKT